MKFIIILLFFVFSSFVEISGDDRNSDMENIGLFQTLAIEYLSTFNSKQCPTTSEKMQEESNKAVECVKNIRYNCTFCDTFVHHFKPCVQGILDKIKKCEDPVGFTFMNTILDSFVEEAKYICNVDGEHIFEIFNPCVLKSVHKSSECRNNLTEAIEHRKNPIALCSAFPSLQECFENQMKQECGKELTKTTLHDLFSVDVKPCNVAMMLYFELASFVV